jgi:hypothetical protein
LTAAGPCAGTRTAGPVANAAGPICNTARATSCGWTTTRRRQVAHRWAIHSTGSVASRKPAARRPVMRH